MVRLFGSNGLIYRPSPHDHSCGNSEAPHSSLPPDQLRGSISSRQTHQLLALSLRESYAVSNQEAFNGVIIDFLKSRYKTAGQNRLLPAAADSIGRS